LLSARLRRSTVGVLPRVYDREKRLDQQSREEADNLANWLEDAMQQALIELVQNRPEIILVISLMCFVLLILLPLMAFAIFSSGAGRRQMVKELLDNPAVQERMKDPQLNLSEFIGQLLRSEDEIEKAARSRTGLLSKVANDITWDVSGVIGLIVTIVLMIMIVSRTYTDIPREVLAGWTTILGFYFGKAVKK
jgi:predicted PurR-regulated permease PerM